MTRSPSPLPVAGRRVAFLVGLVLLAAVLGSPGCGDTQLSPLDQAWRSGLLRIDTELQRGAHRSAHEALGHLKSQIDQIESLGEADVEAVARVRENIECLRMEIQAWEALHAGNTKLASGVIGLAQTQRDCTGDCTQRLAALRERVDGAAPSGTSYNPPSRPDRPPPPPPPSGPGPKVHGAQWLEIPGRSYKIGTPRSEVGRDGTLEITPRNVSVRRYWISTTEVTQRTFGRYVPRTWRMFPGPDRPAHSVSYKEAVEFCEELTRRIGGYTFRLPTETEWEIACRGTRDPSAGAIVLPNRDDQKSIVTGPPDKAEWVLRKYAWFSLQRNEPQPVAQLRRTATWFDARRTNGLFDMHGNAAEWCAPDPQMPWKQPDLLEQATRGGSYQSQFERCRAGARAFQKADSKLPSLGFRIVAQPR